MRLTIIFLTFCSVFFFSNSTAQGIEFFHGKWREALVEAEKEDKLIFIDCYTTWCGPCKRMSKKVFTQSKVGDFFNENFINLKLDMDKTDGKSFGREYVVSAYPTLYFINYKGEVIKQVTGGKQADPLIELGKAAMLGYDKSGNYAEAYDNGERDFDLVYNYVNELNKVGKPSQKIANDYMTSKPDITEAQKAEFLMAAVTASDSKLFQELVKVKSLAIAATSAETFETKVKEASFATIAKAVEYDYLDLLTEAKDNYKSAGLDNNKKFELEADMQYNLLAGNYVEWKTLSDKFLKKYAKKNPELYKDQLKALQEAFKYEDDFQTYACDVCKQMVKKEDSVSNYSRYIELLLGCKNYAEARKITNEAIKKANSRDEKVTKFEQYLKFLDNL